MRRPVFDGALEVVAYEIVLGDGPISELEADDDNGANRLLANSFVPIDLDGISAEKPVYLTLSQAILESGLPPQLTPEQVMLVLGSEVDPSPETVPAVEKLRARGFRILLDDLTTNLQLHPLLRLADAVRINVGLAGGPSFAKQISVLQTARVTLIADGVGSYEELRGATKLGFDHFQGSFLSRPDAFRKTRVPDDQLASLELITLLQDQEAEINDIAEVIRRDVSLSYRILKIVNSAQYSLPRPLGSIQEAVMLVGTKKIVSWVGMMSMSGLNKKPAELTRTAMIRAGVCETLAGDLGRPDVQRFHIVGLFSVIEALLDVPAQQALGSLPLSPEIVDAITSHGGIMGEVLRGVIAYEAGDWEHAHIIELEDRAIMAAFLTATIETDKTWSQIGG
ncbi:MAG: HDOD domain-containing protein [bacterium]|nr:HDOD domain-containing protein [bacterium]MCP4968735.1 HDOD domain-containing protein [bacterium]